MVCFFHKQFHCLYVYLMIKKFFTLVSILLVMFSVSSCNKHNKLFAEVKATDAELKKCTDEIESIDAQLARSGLELSHSNGVLERQVSQLKSEIVKLEFELKSSTAKCNEAEAAAKNMRPLVETYKTKFTK